MTRTTRIKKTIKLTDIQRIERAKEVTDFPKSEAKFANCKEGKQNFKVEDRAGGKDLQSKVYSSKRATESSKIITPPLSYLILQYYI